MKCVNLQKIIKSFGMKKIFIVALSVLATASVSAQTTRRAQRSRALTRVTNYEDSLRTAFAGRMTQLASASVKTSDETDVALSPYMYRMLGQGMYYSSSVKNNFNIDWDAPAEEATSEDIAYREELNDAVDKMLAKAYVTSPNVFSHYDAQLANVDVESDVVAEAKADQLEGILGSAETIDDVADIFDDVNVDLEVTKPNFWKTSGKFSLQFTQNYLSQNWYKGGNNNVTNLTALFLSANYNDQKLIQWDNSLDLRLGFMSAPSDTCHSFLTNTDKINLNSKVGVKATKSSWFYTFSMQAYTQFLPGYKSNDRRRYSAFLAPLDVTASIGMDYKPKLKKEGCSLSMALLPLSYKLRYIGVDDENIYSAYNMKEDGKNLTAKHDFGSRLEFNSNFRILDNLTWKCRLYYYTTYEYAESEMENVFSYSFSKYFSTELYTLWRFDDNRNPQDKDSTLGYFQFKEYFTIGLTYGF